MAPFFCLQRETQVLSNENNKSQISPQTIADAVCLEDYCICEVGIVT